MEIAFGLTKGEVSILLHAQPVSDHPEFLLPFILWYRAACVPSDLYVILKVERKGNFSLASSEGHSIHTEIPYLQVVHLAPDIVLWPCNSC